MEGNSIKSFENLCKIFEMRIKLDKERNIKTPSDVIDNYEKYAKKIDSIYNKEFEKEIRNLISPEVTLEKEETRLKRLIKLLEERLDKRRVYRWLSISSIRRRIRRKENKIRYNNQISNYKVRNR